MTSLGDVYLDVHANTKGLPGEVRRGAKKIGPEGEVAGREFSKGFDRGFVLGRRRSGVFRTLFRFFTMPIRTFVKGIAGVGKTMVDVFKNASEGASLVGTTFKALGKGGLGLAVTLGKTGIGLAVVAAAAVPLATILVGLAGAVTALAATLSFALVGAIGAVVAVLGPAIAGMGVLGLAFIGMSDKAKKAAKQAFKPLTNELKKLGAAARGPLLKALPGIAKALEGPLRNLQPLVRGISRAIGDVGLGFAQAMKSPGFKAFRDSMEKFLPFAIRQLGAITRQTLGGLGGIFRGMIPFMTTVLKNLNNMTKGFSEWANSAKGQTAIKGFFQNVLTSSRSVWNLLKSIGSLIATVFSPGRIAGDNIIDSLAKNIRTFVDYLRANPDTLANFFQSGIAVARIMGQLFIGLMKGLGLIAVNAAKAAQWIGKIMLALSLVPGPQSGLLKSTGQALLDIGNDAMAMSGDIRNAIAAMQELGNTDGTPKLRYESFRAGAERIKASGRTVGQVLQSIDKEYTPTVVVSVRKEQLDKLKTNLAGLGKGAGGKGGFWGKPVEVGWKWKDLAKGKAPWSTWGSGGKGAGKSAVKVAWEWAKNAIGGSKPGAAGGKPKPVTQPWKWGKAPKFPKVDGGKVTIKISGAGAFDKAKEKAKQLTSALKGADKVDPSIKIKDNAGTAKSRINSVKSALNSLDGKTSHVYIVTHKKTVGGYMGGPAPSALSFARGGKLPGSSPSDPTVDNLRGFFGNSPIALRSGEFIMNEPATKMFMPLLEAMNRAGNKSIGMPGRAEGGAVDMSTVAAPTLSLTDAQMRRQAEYNAAAMEKRRWRLDGQGNLQLLKAGG